MRRPCLAACAALAALAAAPVAANDSSAVLGAGGLVLRQSADIAMASEDLYVSTGEIRVRYEFRNTSAADITTVVAFPLPEVDLSVYSEVPIDVPSADPDNFVDFRVAVDGRAVDATLEIRAITAQGADVTDLLTGLGVPLSLFEPDWYDRMSALPLSTKKELVRRGLADFDFDYGGVYPQWTLRTAFHWEQRFPAARTVVVEHRYEPVVGQQFFGTFALDETEQAAFWRRDVCIDAGTERALRRKLAAIGGEFPYLLASTVDYILTTGANWKGPIGEFTLTIDKGSPDNLVSLCIDGIEKTGPTTFEVRRRDFTPTEDLRFVVFHAAPTE